MSTQEERQHIIDVFHRRYATKKFDSNKKISDADWQTIIEAGRLSPSSFGYEPWKFLLIENPEIKEDLKKICWGAVNSLNGASHFVIILSRKNVTINSPHVKHMVEDVMGVDFDVHSPPKHCEVKEGTRNYFKCLPTRRICSSKGQRL